MSSEVSILQDQVKWLREKLDAKESDSADKRREETYRWVTFALPFIIAAIGAAVEAGRYFDQRSAEQRFELNEQMIELVGTLNTSGDAGLRRQAATQLSLYGYPAVPLLIESLDIAHESKVYESIIARLERIVKELYDEDDPARALDVVEQLARATAAATRKDDAGTVDALTARWHVRALARVARQAIEERPGQAASIRQVATAALQEAQRRVLAQPDDGGIQWSSDEEKQELLAAIVLGLKEVQS
jgi:hypothetical protein